jgi:hypothetical protein
MNSDNFFWIFSALLLSLDESKFEGKSNNIKKTNTARIVLSVSLFNIFKSLFLKKRVRPALMWVLAERHECNLTAMRLPLRKAHIF